MDPRHYRAVQTANIIAPGLGALVSIPAVAVLLDRASRYGDAWQFVSCAIYGVSMVIAYLAFTTYHLFKFHERWGTTFKIIDHTSIYLLIAGTYTPFTLVYLRGSWGWTLFSSVWGLTLAGIFFKILFVHRFKIVGPLIYLGMGWLIVLAARAAIEHIPRGALYLLLAGGLFYSSGLLFYGWKRLLLHHAIWHLFVLAGTVSHFFAVLYCVRP